MQRTLFSALLCCLFSAAVLPTDVAAQTDSRAAAMAAAAMAASSSAADPATPAVAHTYADSLSTAPVLTDAEAKIRNAMSSAPPSIANDATILDWPAGPGEAMAVLREGTNGWTCLPDMHHTTGNDPMCVDAPWLEFLDAMGSRRAPKITQLGFGYMLQANDSPYSNTDPFAAGPTPDNEWQEIEGPHLMLLVPDEKMLKGISRDPENGGVWVMFDGTPYVHIMAPMPLYEPEAK